MTIIPRRWPDRAKPIIGSTPGTVCTFCKQPTLEPLVNSRGESCPCPCHPDRADRFDCMRPG